MNRIVRFARLFPLLALAAAACGGEPPARAPREAPNPLLTPTRLTETAPPTFRVRLETSAGTVVLLVHRDWAPLGVDRFYNLVKNGFYDDTRVYRVLDGFMAQFGLNGDPRVNMAWRNNVIVDDPVGHSNTRGTVSFAKGGLHSRTTEVFINYRDNPSLDERGFSPIAEVVEGMGVVDGFYDEYGDGPPRGEGPYQAQVQARGNAYLDASFPELTRIRRAVIEPPGA
ncbi:MAG TPA: peptidylprolyl isomerase [Longimicrobiales bacterium]|nr:peptidylprolyl isomerase [Longimicrobiales bacterium]